MSIFDILNTFTLLKKNQAFLEKRTDSRARAEKILEEPATSCDKKQRSTQKMTGICQKVTGAKLKRLAWPTLGWFEQQNK